MLLVVDEGAQASQCALLVLRLVARFRTFDEDFLDHARVGIFPVVAQAHAGFHLIDVLSASATRTEGVPFNFALVDDHVEGFGLGQYSHGGCRGVHAALRFGGGHALHAVNATLVLECAIDVSARDGANDLLETARCAFASAAHFEVPALRLAVFRVHTEEVASKEGGFVATRTTADFEDSILCVLGVFGYEHEFDFLLELWDARFAEGHFFACHLAHFGVVLAAEQDVLALLQVAQEVGVLFARVHQVLQFLVLLGQSHIALLVSNHGGVGNQGGHFLEARNEAVQFF